jgi:hypothetical protein
MYLHHVKTQLQHKSKRRRLRLNALDLSLIEFLSGRSKDQEAGATQPCLAQLAGKKKRVTTSHDASSSSGRETHLSLFSRTSNERERDRAHDLKRFEGENASFFVQLNTIIGLEPADMAQVIAGQSGARGCSGEWRKDQLVGMNTAF